MESIHRSVLLDESVAALNLKSGSVVVDATLGAGGHSQAIAEKIKPSGILIAFDQDPQVIERFAEQKGKQKFGNGDLMVHLINKNFSELKDSLFSLDVQQVDAILADLGISSDQLADSELGLSFLEDAPLDMRLDRARELTANKIVNTYSQTELSRLLRVYADEQFAVRIARAICQARTEAPINSTKQLVAVIGQAVPEKFKHGKTHFATKTFQALRIAVNAEFENLEKFLLAATELLRPGGRLGVITFHSGEDRIVKDFFRRMATGCVCPPEFPLCQCANKAVLKLITKKPRVSGIEELASNPRARSAKLRVAEKI